MSTPYYCFFVSDFYGSHRVRAMNFIERALYREMIDLSWEKVPLKDDPEEVAKLIHGAEPGLVTVNWKKVRECFQRGEDGNLINDRVERERERALAKSEKARSSAKARWGASSSSQPTSAAVAAAGTFDFEAVWQLFPRRASLNEGRAEGLAACREQITTAEDYKLLLGAASNYARLVERKAKQQRLREEEKQQFTLSFRSFMGKWRDYVVETGAADASKEMPGSLISADEKIAWLRARRRLIERAPWEPNVNEAKEDTTVRANTWSEEQRLEWLRSNTEEA